MRSPRLPAVAVAIAALAAMALPALADDPVFTLEFKDGVITPSTLEVPANTRFKIVVNNTGVSPAEFESAQLQREKVIAPGSSSFVIIRGIAPGDYPFFDDFHPNTPQGKLTAK